MHSFPTKHHGKKPLAAILAEPLLLTAPSSCCFSAAELISRFREQGAQCKDTFGLQGCPRTQRQSFLSICKTRHSISDYQVLEEIYRTIVGRNATTT